MDLLEIPGVGKTTKKELNRIGIHKVDDLCDKDPEKLYEMRNKFNNVIIDRCVLYIYRCAVYYANNRNIDKEKIRWWDFKD